MKKNILHLLCALALVMLYGAFVLPDNVMQRLSFLWSNAYYYPVYASLVIAFILVIWKLSERYKREYLVKIIYGILFLPAVFFPMLKCYFKVPFIFCRACPRKCMWGELLPMMLPSFILINLDKRYWCYKLCPVGTLQEYQCKATDKRISLPTWTRIIRPVILTFTIFVVAGLFFFPQGFDWFFKGTQHFYIWSFSMILLIFILSFFIPRCWCNYICPIGSLGDVALKAQNKFKDKI